MSHALYPIPEQPTDADGRPRTAAVSVVTARRVDPNSPSSPAPVRRPPGSATDRRRAFDEAKALYEAGVSIARDNPLSAVAHFLQAAHMFEEVHGQDKNRDKSLWQAGVCYGRVGYNLRLRRDWDGAREAFRDALELFTAIRDVEKEATTLYQLSLVSSDVLSASELLKKAALIYSDLDDEVREAMCLAELGNLFGKREKDLASSLFHWRQALLLYLKIGDKEKEARALYSIGEILVRSDRQAAHDHFLQAKAVFQHLGGKSAKWFGNCSYQLGKLCVAEKAFPAAVEHFEEACTVFRNIELETDEAWALYRLALVMLKVDSRDLAIDYLTEARRLFAEVGNERQAEGSCLLRLGEIFKHTNPDMAKTLLEEALEFVDPETERIGKRSTMILEHLRGKEIVSTRRRETANGGRLEVPREEDEDGGAREDWSFAAATEEGGRDIERVIGDDQGREYTHDRRMRASSEGGEGAWWAI